MAMQSSGSVRSSPLSRTRSMALVLHEAAQFELPAEIVLRCRYAAEPTKASRQRRVWYKRTSSQLLIGPSRRATGCSPKIYGRVHNRAALAASS
jgi:hypothetical protein